MIFLNTFKKRIDELGRIVIPKEIRKSYKINNYDELELTAIDDKIVITKSIGIKEYKEKIKKYITLIKNICNYDIFIVEKDNIVESSIDNLCGNVNIEQLESFNNLKKTINIDNKEISGYIYLDKIIIDSNLLGYIIFINKEIFTDTNLLKNIKNVFIDLIN